MTNSIACRFDADCIAKELTVSEKQDDAATETEAPPKKESPKLPKEIGGPKGPEPTRYGDWERNGRCTDF